MFTGVVVACFAAELTSSDPADGGRDMVSGIRRLTQTVPDWWVWFQNSSIVRLTCASFNYYVY
jgi:hypothetical protein